VSRRHTARQTAVQALCWLESQPGDIQTIIGDLVDSGGLDDDSIQFAVRLTQRTLSGQDSYDEEIAVAVKNRDSDRVGRLERIVIRLALAEIDSKADVPVSVILDESVELAGEFVDEDAAAFVNGVLDGVVRQRSERTADAVELDRSNCATRV